MKIQHLPPSPKATVDFGYGIGIEHVRNDVGNLLCASGLAKYLGRPNYGTKEWIEERQALDSLGAPPQPPAAIEWGVFQPESPPLKAISLLVKQRRNLTMVNAGSWPTALSDTIGGWCGIPH